MLTVEQMCAVVEHHIYKKTGRWIQIQLRYHPFFLPSDLEKLNYAYGIALEDV